MNSITEAILNNTDLDILKAFTEISSLERKMQVITDVLNVYKELRTHLSKHRCLVILAHLLEELNPASTLKAATTSRHFLQQWLGSDAIPQAASDHLGVFPSVEIRDLPRQFRKQGSLHLRDAILDACAALQRNQGGNKQSPSSSSFHNASVHVKAPVRLDLGMGGISDIPPYSLECYGNCVNVPIRVNGFFPLESRAEWINESLVRFTCHDSKIVKAYSNFLDFDDAAMSLLFHKEVFRFFVQHILGLEYLQELFSSLKGGFHLESLSRLPVGTGLGVSSLLLSALCKVIFSHFDIHLTPQMLLAMSVYLENVTGIGGGWEDATAIYSGVKLIESFPDAPLSPHVKQLSLSEASLQALREQVVLIYTGIPKMGNVHFDTMVEGYCLRDPNTINAIKENNSLNKELGEFLVAGELAGVGHIFQRQWENWKLLSGGSCTNSQIDYLFTEVAPYVYGARLNGAGGGGCAMFAAKAGKTNRLIQTIRTILGASATIYQWDPVV